MTLMSLDKMSNQLINKQEMEKQKYNLCSFIYKDTYSIKAWDIFMQFSSISINQTLKGQRANILLVPVFKWYMMQDQTIGETCSS